MFLFVGAILFKVVKLQFFERAIWENQAEKERVYYKKVVATRGSILSDNGTIMATTQPYFRLSIDPSVIKTKGDANFEEQIDTLCKNMAAHFGNEEFGELYFKEKLNRAIEREDRHLYLLKRPVNFREYKMARNWPILKASPYKGGLIGEKLSNKRFYPFKNLAKITLGVLRDDTLAQKGLEYSFNKELRGQDGQVLMQKLGGGQEIPLENFGDSQAQDGYDVVTTLNLEIQDIAETALKKALFANKAKYGVALVMEVSTGEIKGIANLRKSKDGKTYFEDYNYAVADAIEPGSTIKLASMIAALEDNAVSISDSIDTGKGFVQFYDVTISDHVAMGKITYQQAFEKSSNVVFAKMIQNAYKDDPGKFISRLDQLGLTKSVNSQMIGEGRPYIPNPGDTRIWKGTTLPSLAIGYNLSVTPLQLLTLYNAVANDGKMVAPRFVRELRQDSKVIEKYGPQVLRKQICSASTLKTMRKLLEGVVERGTAENIKSSQYAIAGKTGTARKVVEDKYEKIYRASFCGYFPADAPKYTVFVLVDEPSTGSFYGSSVAAPIFREIADKIYAMDLELAKNPREAEGQSSQYPVTRIISQHNADQVYNKLDISTPDSPEAEWVKTTRNGEKIEYQPITLRPGVMPDVKGMSARDAVNLLESRMLKVRRIGHGKVVRQSVEPGKAVGDGTEILLEMN